jgi:predicted nucleic acid-binding Zn finger protein
MAFLAAPKSRTINCNLNDYKILKELEISLLEQLRDSYEKEKLVSDDLLESLYFIYKNPLLEALNTIDKFDQQEQSLLNETPKYIDLNTTTNTNATAITANKQPNKNLVTLLRSNSNRFVYQVKGSIGIYYYIFNNVNFCTCSSFKFNVLNKFKYLYCKHLIMIKLLKAMNKINERHIKDTEMANIVRQIQ